jgi:hypothetical protein
VHRDPGQAERSERLVEQDRHGAAYQAASFKCCIDPVPGIASLGVPVDPQARRPRRLPEPQPRHRRPLDAPGRSRLEPLRRRHRPISRSPTLTNTTRRPPEPRPIRRVGTLLSTSSALDVHPRVAMRILRDAQIDVTMNVYTEVSDARTLHALKRLGRQLGS